MKRLRFTLLAGIVSCGVIASAWVFGTESGREWRLQHLNTADLLTRTLSHPEDTLAHRLLAERLLAEGRFEEAATAYAALARLEPSSAAPLVAQGRALLLAGKPREALTPLEESLRHAPQDADANAALGEAHYALGERVQAEQRLAAAVRQDPSNSTAQAGLAFTLADNHNFDAARSAADRAMRLAPKSAEGYIAAGYVADKMGNSPEAVRTLSRAVQIDPRHGRAWELLAAVRVRVARGSEQIAQAEVALMQAERLWPRSPRVPYYRGLLRAKQQRYTDAATEFRRALERDPYMIDALYNLSLALAFAGKKAESARVREQFRRASGYVRERSRLQMRIGRDPQRADLWERLARLAEANGDAQMAELARSRREAVAKSPLSSGD